MYENMEESLEEATDLYGVKASAPSVELSYETDKPEDYEPHSEKPGYENWVIFEGAEGDLESAARVLFSETEEKKAVTDGGQVLEQESSENYETNWSHTHPDYWNQGEAGGAPM